MNFYDQFAIFCASALAMFENEKAKIHTEFTPEHCCKTKSTSLKTWHLAMVFSPWPFRSQVHTFLADVRVQSLGSISKAIYVTRNCSSTCVVDLLNLGMILQEFSQSLRVVALPLNTHVQSLQSPGQQGCVKWRLEESQTFDLQNIFGVYLVGSELEKSHFYLQTPVCPLFKFCVVV